MNEFMDWMLNALMGVMMTGIVALTALAVAWLVYVVYEMLFGE